MVAEKKNWEFFCKEIAKGNEIIKAYRQIYKKIDMIGSAYDPFFQLILDCMTAKLVLITNYIFDSQDDALRLTRAISDLSYTGYIHTLSEEYKDLINFRHKKVAHINKIYLNNKSYQILTEPTLKRIEKLFKIVSGMLNKQGAKEFDGVLWADDWPNISTSRELMFERLEENELLRNSMSIQDLYSLKQK